MPQRPSILPLSLSLCLLPWTTGCGDKEGDDSASGAASPCEEETRAEPLAVGSTFSGSAATITVTAATPLPPTAGDNTWTLVVATSDGTTLEDCTITATSKMPDHGHGGPAPSISADSSGGYSFAASLTMSGYWEISTDLSCPGQDITDTVTIAICAE